MGVLKGIDIVANAVKVTLGAGGRTVIISDGGFPTRTTKDGVTVANSISLRDDIENAGAKMIKEISSKTSEDVGDGTTTVCVLMQEIVREGMGLVQAGINPMLLKRGIEIAVKSIVATLDRIAIPIGEGSDLLKQIASVSANNDKEIGDLVGEVFSKLGKYGMVAIEDSKSPDTWVEQVNGFEFDSGWSTYHFINNSAKNSCELANPYFLIVEGKLTKFEEIMPLIEKAVKQQKPIVFIAEDFEFEVIRDIVHNIERGVLKCVCIKYNFIGETKEELMLDLCAMTGATLISEKTGKKIQNLQLEYLGECEKIVCTKDETKIIQGKQSAEAVKSRIEDANVKIENAKNIFRKQQQERRIAKLSGGIALCYVGGKTEVERSEKKDRIDDSIRATKAAIEEGVVPGGGTALIRCIANLNELRPETEHDRRGIELVKMAIEKPAFQIIKNAIGKGELVVEEVKQKFGNFGYNALTDQIEDLVKSGIIDPKKVVRVCIENAASAAVQVLISEALIVNDIPNDKM